MKTFLQVIIMLLLLMSINVPVRSGEVVVRPPFPNDIRIERPIIVVGQWWESRTGNRMTVTDVQPNRIEMERGDAVIILDLDMNVTERRFRNGTSQYLKPPSCWHSYPLFLGKEWQCNYEFRAETGIQTHILHYTIRAKALEWSTYTAQHEGKKVIMPALKIVYTVDERERYNFDRITVTCWYPPEMMQNAACLSERASYKYAFGAYGGGNSDPASLAVK